jgi:drug/metabolite transporter (DMT)-like permease
MATASVAQAVQPVVTKLWQFAGVWSISIVVALVVTQYFCRGRPKQFQFAVFSLIAIAGGGLGWYLIFRR